ncbi:MAG: DUF4382 domain-containing protein [bacterium]|nr:DUF4382 domain-containing protein [bacterium]
MNEHKLSHNRYHGFYLLLILALGSIFIGSCETEVREIDPLDEQFVFTRNSDIGTILENISLLDGSFDNILDNSSFYRVELPVTIQFQGESILISNLSDIENIRTEYLKNPYLGFPRITSYPITLLSDQYENMVITDESNLLEVIGASRNRIDQDIECVDFQYPIKLASYDQLNQLADVITVRSDEELYWTILNGSSDDILGLQFPVALLNHEGDEELVDDNQSFENVLSSQGSVCDESDIIYDQNLDVPQLETLTLSLTDAPFPYDSVAETNVTISRIELNTGNDTIPTVLITDQPQTYNILQLINGVSVNIGSVDLPAGTFDSFKLFISESCVTMKNGETFEILLTDDILSGITIKPIGELEIQEFSNPTFLLDFNLGASFLPFVVDENIVGFDLVPKITSIDLANSGSLSGIVTSQEDSSPLGNAQISIFAEDTLFTSSASNELGEYRIIGLPAGNYKVVAELDDYEDLELLDVVIEIDMETTLNISLTPGDSGDDGGRITICHIPPGNPDNARTIEIDASAWPAHEAHGDYLGECVD